MQVKIENESKLFQKYRNTKFQEFKALIEFVKLDAPDCKDISEDEINLRFEKRFDEQSIKNSIKSNLHQY
ncbi:MAG: hypothetical protein H0T84_07600 [Tatlockia sp.]|nr:hypothetical protein [Tatlockia sp.]